MVSFSSPGGDTIKQLKDQIEGLLHRPAARIFLSVFGGLAAVLGTPSLLRTTDTLFYTNSIFPLILLVFYTGLFYRMPCWATPKRLGYTLPLGLLFSAMMVAGSILETTGDIAFGSLYTYLPILACWPLFCSLLTLLWHALDNQKHRAAPRNGRAKSRLGHFWRGLGFWRWVLCWVALLLCWLPVLLASWPGFFTYDAMAQYQQFSTGAFTGHHPPLHTFLMGFGISGLAELFGSINAGITAWIFLQMMAVAACFVRVLWFLRQKGQPLWLRTVSLLYFGLFPTIAMFVCCTSKDTLFSALILLFLLDLWQALEQGRAFFASPWRTARLALVTFLMLCLRNNAPYALLPALPLILKAAPKPRRTLAVVLAAPLLLFFLYSGPLLGALDVQPGDAREMLSVPMQQLARVHQRAPETFSDADKSALYRLIPPEALAKYHPKLADPVKQNFHTGALWEDPPAFLGLWLKTGLRQPGIYLNAFLENTVDAWYPGSLVNGYNFPGERERVFEVGGTSYFYALLEPPATPDSKLPALLAFYQTLAYQISWHKIPLVSLLFSPAFMSWILVLCLAYLRYRGARGAAAPLWYLLFLYATCLLGPIVQVRYLLYLFFSLPLLVGLFFPSHLEDFRK